MTGLYKVIQKMVHEEYQDKIDWQISIYKNTGGLFGFDIAIRNWKKKSPGKKHVNFNLLVSFKKLTHKKNICVGF